MAMTIIVEIAMDDDLIDEQPWLKATFSNKDATSTDQEVLGALPTEVCECVKAPIRRIMSG